VSDQGWFLDELTYWSAGLKLQPDTFENFMQELIESEIPGHTAVDSHSPFLFFKPRFLRFLQKLFYTLI